MKPIVLNRVTCRDYENTDYEVVVNLELKEGDREELFNMSEMTPKEYFMWHLDNHSGSTKVITYDNVIIGITGIDTEESIFWFTTISLPRSVEFNFVRAFKGVLEGVMLDACVKSVITYMDSNYTSAIKWAVLGGFKKIKEVYINGNEFFIMKYTKKLP